MSVRFAKPFPEINIYYSAFIANLCATAATCIMSWSSPTLPLITKKGAAKIYVTEEEGSWISSIPALGACLGPFVSGALVDCLGRKRTLLATMLLFVVTWAVIYFSTDISVVLCARFIGGLGVGCVYATLPMFLAEISPVRLRGTLGSLIQLFDCFAYLIVYIAGSFVSYENLILVSAALPLVCFFTFMCIPESPYQLHNKGKERKALKALHFFRGHSDPIKLEKDINEMQASAENLKNNKGSVLQIFSGKGNLKIIYYSAALVISQQGSGINIITFYAKSIFEESGSSLFSADSSSIIVAAVMTFTAVFTSTAAKIFRIRNLLIFSSIGIALSMGILGTYFFAKDSLQLDTSTSAFSWVPVASLVFFIFAYTLGYGPLIWVITSEIFPSHLKALGCALTASFAWLLTFLLTRYFAPFSEEFGKAPIFWSFAVIGVLSLFFVVYSLPETQDKSFQEIQDMIHGNNKRKESSKNTVDPIINHQPPSYQFS